MSNRTIRSVVQHVPYATWPLSSAHDGNAKMPAALTSRQAYDHPLYMPLSFSSLWLTLFNKQYMLSPTTQRTLRAALCLSIDFHVFRASRSLFNSARLSTVKVATENIPRVVALYKTSVAPVLQVG